MRRAELAELLAYTLRAQGIVLELQKLARYDACPEDVDAALSVLEVYVQDLQRRVTRRAGSRPALEGSGIRPRIKIGWRCLLEHLHDAQADAQDCIDVHLQARAVSDFDRVRADLRRQHEECGLSEKAER